VRHLSSALLSVGLIAVLLIGDLLYARWMEGRYIHALASRMFPRPVDSDSFGTELTIVLQGSALQTEAFRQPDLLPLYGSSELIWRGYQGKFNGSELFRTYPTGFALFPVGKPGTPALAILQHLAAIGGNLEGKKVAISLSPAWLRNSSQDEHNHYRGNFSRLHAGELAFSTDLSFDFKHDAAQRMLDFPATLESDPLLRFALEKLADGSARAQAIYYALLPLGKLQNLVLRLQDHWETLALIRSQPDLVPDVPRVAAALDWPSLVTEADRLSQRLAGQRAQRSSPEASPESSGDRQFLGVVRQSPEWTDLDLLMRGLAQLGAQPIILSQPLAGAAFDHLRVRRSAREAYYERFRKVTRPYGVPVIDFAEHDEDPFFVVNVRSHLSAKGWAYYDRALDAFYHGADSGPKAHVAADRAR
jgi:D-alanine transfer protein